MEVRVAFAGKIPGTDLERRDLSLCMRIPFRMSSYICYEMSPLNPTTES